MKTLLIDNSLCSLPLKDDADPELIYSYICALSDAGVGAVELDFRTLMKLDCYPKKMKYIFRLVDPVFLSITEHFRFDYLAVSFGDLQKGNIKTDVPLMLSLPILEDPMNMAFTGFVRYVNSLAYGKISLVNLYGSYPVMSRQEIVQYMDSLRKNMFIPFDICPMNALKSAASNAINFTLCEADAVTVTTGSSVRCCSLEEYFSYFTSVIRSLPKGLNFPAAALAVKLNSEIFRTGLSPELDRLVKEYKNDILYLSNGETGQKLLQGKRTPIPADGPEEYGDFEVDLKKFSVYHGLGRGNCRSKILH